MECHNTKTWWDIFLLETNPTTRRKTIYLITGSRFSKSGSSKKSRTLISSPFGRAKKVLQFIIELRDFFVFKWNLVKKDEVRA